MSTDGFRLKRHFALSYMVQAALLLLAYFLAVPDSPFTPESQGIGYAVSLWPDISRIVGPVVFIMYGIQSAIMLSALASLAERSVTRRDVFFHLLSTALYLFMAFIVTVVLYMLLRPITTHFKNTGITEIPFVLSYLFCLILVAISWLYFMWAKWVARVRYFQHENAGIGIRTLLGGLGGKRKVRRYLAFSGIVFLMLGIPAGLLSVGMLGRQPILIAGAVMAATLAFSYGHFLLLLNVWKREESLLKPKKEEAKPPRSKSRKVEKQD